MTRSIELHFGGLGKVLLNFIFGSKTNVVLFILGIAFGCIIANYESMTNENISSYSSCVIL